MAHQITPSRKKFRIARKFARELQRIYGKDLVAVFVAGSVAANMAVPESDIELIFFYAHKSARARKKEQQVGLLIKKFAGTGSKMSVSALTDLSTRGALGDLSLQGMVPLFSNKKILEKIGWNPPTISTILQRYLHPRPKKPSITSRISFKRSIKGRQRFLPR